MNYAAANFMPIGPKYFFKFIDAAGLTLPIHIV
jgi:hypothetical protein